MASEEGLATGGALRLGEPGHPPAQGPAADAGDATQAERTIARTAEPASPAALARRRVRAETNGGANGNGAAHALDAPHRRQERRPRIHEGPAVHAYRGFAWLVGHLPARLAWTVGGWVALAGYVLWPTKRRWVRANFGHVLGVPASDPAAGRLARAAYWTYARYVVELLRLPGLDRRHAADLVMADGLERFKELVAESRGTIVVVAHLANNEALGAGLASHGLPVSVVADDTAYDELFDLLRRQRAVWGVQLIPWRNLRAVYGVLRRREILGLLVDWGYRPDGIPVRFFDAWTTLPAGPAVLAARNGATIVPVLVRREEDGRFRAWPAEPIRVASTAPAELLRATQAIADELAAGIAAVPEQWYIFKPIWPDDPAEAERLERLAGQMAADRGGEARAGAEAALP